MTLLVHFERADDGTWWAWADENVGGAVSASGKTRDEARTKFRDTLRFHMEGVLENAELIEA